MDPDTPKPGETGTPKAPENNTQPQAPTSGNASDTAVEQLRKEKEQAEMRANQLANQLKTREEADAAAAAKKLEEQNEFKTLFEQEKAKRQALEAEQAEKARTKELADAKAEVLADYSDEVKALAEETGMTLADTDDASKAAFKEKLDKIDKRVSTNSKVTPNNPGTPNRTTELSPDQLRADLQDEQKFQEIIAQRPGLAMMMKPQR